ncbi:MAG: lysylphosphatidylglycerol synthase transmembrane domain-containing protein [Candidatus Binatia bacterium]
MRRLRGAARWGLRLAVSLGIVTYILTQVDREHLWQSLTGVRLSWIVVALLLYLVGQGLSAVKWAVLGRSVGLRGSYAEYGRFYFIGMFFNLLGVSTLGGDVVRALYLARGHRPGLAIDSVLFDRVSGLAVLAALGSVAMLAWPRYEVATPIRIAVVTAGSLLVIGWWLCPRLVELLPVDNRFRRQVEIELAPFWRDRRVLVRAVALAVVFHVSQACVQWVLGRAAGVALPLTYCLVFHPMVSVLMALPVSIGGFGVREGAYVYFLALVGVHASTAVTISLLWWAVTVIAGLVGGAIFIASGAELPKFHLPRFRRRAAV